MPPAVATQWASGQWILGWPSAPPLASAPASGDTEGATRVVSGSGDSDGATEEITSQLLDAVLNTELRWQKLAPTLGGSFTNPWGKREKSNVFEKTRISCVKSRSKSQPKTRKSHYFP